MVLSKLAEKCKACPKVDSCDHKKMEMCALAELPHNMCAMPYRKLLWIHQHQFYERGLKAY